MPQPTDRPLDRFVAWCFGVVCPPILFLMDRHMGIEGPGGFVPFRPYSTILAFLSVVFLMVWLLSQSRPRRFDALLAGPLALGAMFALGIGVLLVPLSLFGLLFSGIGVLGFIPFVTGVAFLKAASKADERARAALGAEKSRTLATVSLVFVIGAVWLAGRLTKSVEWRQTEVLAGRASGDPRRAERILHALWLFPQLDLGYLADVARGEHFETGPSVLAYERITGKYIPSD